MSAYAFPSTFAGLSTSSPSPPTCLVEASKTRPGDDAEFTEPMLTSPMPPPPSMKIPPLKLPDFNDEFLTPTKETIAEEISAKDTVASNDSILVNSVVLNTYLLTMSPRTIVRRGSGGGGLMSPRRQARTVGRNGISDAIEVQLTVHFSGRRYNATRSLARIVEVADDLIAESKSEDEARIIQLPYEVKHPSILGSNNSTNSSSDVQLQDRLDVIKGQLDKWFSRLFSTSTIDAANSLVLSSFLYEPIWLSGSATPSFGSSNSSSSSKGKRDDSPIHMDRGLPLAFGRRRSSVRRSSLNDSISTLGSIDESLLF